MLLGASPLALLMREERDEPAGRRPLSLLARPAVNCFLNPSSGDPGACCAGSIFVISGSAICTAGGLKVSYRGLIVSFARNQVGSVVEKR